MKLTIIQGKPIYKSKIFIDDKEITKEILGYSLNYWDIGRRDPKISLQFQFADVEILQGEGFEKEGEK